MLKQHWLDDAAAFPVETEARPASNTPTHHHLLRATFFFFPCVYRPSLSSVYLNAILFSLAIHLPS